MTDKFTWSNLPVKCPHTQMWGENPEVYQNPPSATIPSYPGHNGDDFGCPLYTPGEVIAPGVVDKVANEPAGFGFYIRVWHSKYKVWSYYAHLTSAAVKAGQTVEPGRAVYSTGSSGWSTRPHLHLGVKVQPGHPDYDPAWRGWVNPMAYYVRDTSIPPVPIQPPAPDVPSAIVNLPLLVGRYRVINDAGLNVRSSPSIYGNNIVTRLEKGDEVDASAETGNIFMQIAYQGQVCYCALVYDGVVYLEKVK